MLPINCGSHADYQNFVTENLRKYYPNPDAIARFTRDIIERFWTLDLSYTDELMRDKYSKFDPAPRTPSCMPFLADLKLETHLELVPFMTFLIAYGIQKMIIFPFIFIP